MKRIVKNILAVLNKSEKERLAALTVFNVMISMADIASLALLLFIISFYTGKSFSESNSFFPPWLSDPDSILPISLFLIFFILKSLAGFLVVCAFWFVLRAVNRRAAQALQREIDELDKQEKGKS